MRTFRHISILLALLAVSCTGSKRMAKKAVELNSAGLYAEAAEMYLDAVRRNRHNIDAKIGLKETGQKVLNDKLSEFFKASNMGKKEEAVNDYLLAEKYVGQVRALGVMLEIPDHYQSDYDRVKDAYLLDLYDEGQDLMGQERYEEAQQVFAKIGKLDPAFKDAQSLKDIAYLEPLYKKAKTAFAQKQYRAAYDDLAKIIAKDAGYKDAFAIQADCVELGKYNIAITKFKSNGTDRTITQAVSLFAQNELANMNDPFIKVVDRDNIDRILEEQQLALSGVIDDASAVEVGNLLGAQAVLLGEVVSYKQTVSKVKSERKNGFLKYTAKVKNEETGEFDKVTRYKRTTYLNYKQSANVLLTVNYKLISMETGEILFSKVVEERVDDQVDYSSFSGDKNKLYPSVNGKAATGTRALRQLRSELSARKALRSIEEMRSDAVREVCGGMAYKVKSEIARRMP